MKKILFLTLCTVLLSSCVNNADYPKLTECLNRNQVVMFGASWCPHCASQKQMFGRSLKDMPYFECSKNGEQVKECSDRAITSYPTWQFTEKTLSALPKEAILNLLNTEIEKVRATTKSYKQALASKPEMLAVVTAFESKTEKMIASDISEFEKLTSLTVLAEGDAGKLVEHPVYISGRVAGERALADIALYAGCSTEYQADISASKK